MMEMLAIAAVFYLILTGLLTLLVNHLEVRMSVSRA